MGSGYTRQSAANISSGLTIYAADHNAEYNQLQSAFNGTTGHAHDGSTGNGPKISLTASVSGVLPVANGGIAGIHKLNATTAPSATDDANDGYAVGSIWVDVTNDIIYLCVDSTATAAIWQRIGLYDAGLTSIAGLTTSADKMIYTTASDTYAVTSLTSFARTLLDDATASDAQTTLGITALAKTLLDDTTTADMQTTLGISSFAQTLLDDATATDVKTTLGISLYAQSLLDDIDAATARATLGVSIGSSVQAYDAGLTSIAGLSTSANDMIYATASDTYATTTLTSFARTILDDVDAPAVRTTLGLVIGTNVQAYSADLAAIAALAKTDGNFIVGNGVSWVAESGATVRTSLGLGTMATETATDYVPTTRSVLGGNGLINGGDLTVDRTLALGTPSTLTSSTTNSVTTTSHTHLIDEDDIVSVGSAALAAGAIGTYILAVKVTAIGAVTSGTTLAGSSLREIGFNLVSNSGSSSGSWEINSALAGTWRCMADCGTASTYAAGIWKRIS